MHDAFSGNDLINDLQHVAVPVNGLQALVEMTKGPFHGSSSATHREGDNNENGDTRMRHKPRVRGGKGVQLARVRAALRALGVDVPYDRK